MFRDDDLDSCYDIQPNATCSDCGADFSRGEDDPGTRCDDCSDRHDRHAAILQHRRRMAAARIGAPAPALTAPELSLVVALLGRGRTKTEALDRIQANRHRLPFGSEVA